MFASVGTFLTGTAVFFVLKLTTSIDDVLWLSPFLALADDDVPAKVRCCAVYYAVCLLVTVEAFAIAFAASRGLGAVVGALGGDGEGAASGEGGDGGAGEGYWDASRILCIIASVCIAALACKEFLEWREDQEAEEEEKDKTGGDSETIKTAHADEDQDEPTADTVCITQPSTTAMVEGKAVPAASRDDLPNSLLVLDVADRNEDGGSGSTSLDSAEPVGGGRYKSFRHKESTSFSDEEACVEMDGIPDAQISDGSGENEDEECEVTAQKKPLVQVKVRTEEDEEEDGFDEEEAKGDEKERHTLVSLFVVAFFGTLDDLALFSAVLMGKSIHWLSLLCGSMLAAIVIIFASWCVSLCKPFADVMQRIPLWSLLFAISLYILIDGII